MTRIINTTFIATVLAVATLGLAGTAQADDPGQGIAIGEPPPGQQLPPVAQAEAEPEPDPVAEDAEVEEEAPEEMGEEAGEEIGEEETDEVDYTSPAYFNSKEALDRFKRYCNMKDAEPSHSDKAFCELFRKHHPTTGTTRPKPKPAGTSAGAGSTGIPTGTGSTRPSTDTGDSRPTADGTDTGSTRPATATDGELPAAQTEQASKSSLPFTGLEVWQLALVGVALIGGAFGIRRMLDN